MKYWARSVSFAVALCALESLLVSLRMCDWPTWLRSHTYGGEFAFAVFCAAGAGFWWQRAEDGK